MATARIQQDRLPGPPADPNGDPARQLAPANELEAAIGRQIRDFRTQLHMTAADLASQAGLSPGMLSKIENGLASPSLATLKSLSRRSMSR